MTESAVTVTDRTIDGAYGPIPVRTYLPSNPAQGLVWVHGGAFAFGDLDMPESDWVARQLAQQGVAVVTVDYRLAPVTEQAFPGSETAMRDGVLFPVASKEVTSAFLWAATLIGGLGAERWSLGGASAGANLATGAALRLRDDGGAQPRSLVLAYGLFHADLPPLSAELAAKHGALPEGALVFTPEVVHSINLNYVGEPQALSHAYAFPGGHDLQGLPPSLLLNSDIDGLRASGDRFASELAGAGVDVAVIREPGTTHGHLNDPTLAAASRSIRRMTAWLTSDLRTGGSE